jgi:UDP-2,3-diacylglucosamine hydrolase
MDVNPATVRATLSASGCRLMIHGHTHRPGCERIALADGIAERWVLSDWDTGRGDALEVNASGIRRIDLSS